LRLLVGGVATGLIAGSASVSGAVDQPVEGSKLTIRRSTSGKEKLVLVLKDPSLLFPAIDGVDDPSLDFGPGLLIELFAANDPSRATFVLPSGRARPGWKVTLGKTDRYRFANKAAPGGISEVRTVAMKETGVLKIVAKRTGLALAEPLGAVGVRVTTGTLRNCALFGASTIRKDVAGNFVARHTSAAPLADCATTSLGGVIRCGDGFADETEGCDGADTSKCTFSSDRCMPPGVVNECTCCGGCPKNAGCCGPSIIVGVAPPACSGWCVSTSCEPPWTCDFGVTCENGACCMLPGQACHMSGLLATNLLPCCPSTDAVCAKPGLIPPDDLLCCVVDGGACSADADCCSDVCSAAGTCDPA
jgi:hypothetical protein